MNRTLLLVLVGLTFAAMPAMAAESTPAVTPPPARPTVHALRVPDGAIKIDGNDNDWRQFGDSFAAAKTAFKPGTFMGVNPDRGTWSGPDDLSFDVWVAADSKNVYILANVHDQILVNDSDAKEMFIGDDFEVFVDANPTAAQYGTKRNENTRQFIFRPAWILPGSSIDEVWKADENPGVKMASRLHPWGYTIEVQIPKALFPNWKQDHALDSVGFDIMICDADSPGPDGPHGPLKYAAYLLSPGYHYAGSDKLGRLELDPNAPTATRVMLPLYQVRSSPAQALLDSIDNPGKAVLQALFSKDKATQKAALFILAKRPELSLPMKYVTGLCAPTTDGKYPDTDLVTYALIAMAERKMLPAKAWFDFYAHASDPQLRLTWIWCVGRNGDAAAVPDLETLLTDPNLRIRIKAALAMQTLGDKTALPALEKMKANDPNPYGKMIASQAIEAINAKH